MSDRLKLQLREIQQGHITVTPSTFTAWYILGDQRWPFTTPTQREQLVSNFTHRLIGFTGHRVHVRTTTRPYPSAQWRDQLIALHPHPQPGYADRVRVAEASMNESRTDNKVVFVGIEFKRTRSWRDRIIASSNPTIGSAQEIAEHGEEIERLTTIVAQPGMNGRPATTPEVEWLMHRSVRLLLPEPEQLSHVPDAPWAPEDIYTFTDGVSYEYTPGDPTVAVTAIYNDEPVTHHVAILTLGRVSDFHRKHYADRAPWMQVTDRLKFPVEWFASFDVLAGPEVQRATERKLLSIRDDQRQHRRHGLDAPLELIRNVRHAKRIEDEITTHAPVDASRCHGWWRLAVAGRDRKECLKRVKAVQTLFEAPYQFDIIHAHRARDASEQFHQMRSFIPGEPLGSTAYKRELQTKHVAAGLPHVAPNLGDGMGPVHGYTRTVGKRHVHFHPWFSTEILEGPGLYPVVGEPGSGKSTLIGDIAVEAADAGNTVTIMDPSGPLANACNLSYLKHDAAHIDLMGNEPDQEGILSPWAVIPDPRRDNFDTEAKWHNAIAIKQGDRRILARDTIRMLVPIASEKTHAPTLTTALRAVGGDIDGDLNQVIDVLRDQIGTDVAVELADELQDKRELPYTRLFFPNHVHEHKSIDATLLVLTMNGIQLPNPNDPRSEWGTAEQLAVPILNLAAHFCTARTYGLPRDQRKLLCLDEADKLGQWASGRTLFRNLGVDGRKFNIATLIANQNPKGILNMDIANYIGGAFVGRIEDPEIAAEAERFLRISGYANRIGQLSPHLSTPGVDKSRLRGPRDFIHRDSLGNVDEFRNDLEHKREFLDRMGTTANPNRLLEKVSAR